MNTLQGLLITVVAALPAAAMAQFAPRHTPGIMKKLPVAMEHPVNDTPEGTLHDNMAYTNTYHYYGYDGEIENAESHAIQKKLSLFMRLNKRISLKILCVTAVVSSKSVEHLDKYAIEI